MRNGSMPAFGLDNTKVTSFACSGAKLPSQSATVAVRVPARTGSNLTSAIALSVWMCTSTGLLAAAR